MIQLINQKLGFCPYLKKTYFKKLGFCPYLKKTYFKKLGFCPYLKKTYFKKLGFCPYAFLIYCLERNWYRTFRSSGTDGQRWHDEMIPNYHSWHTLQNDLLIPNTKSCRKPDTKNWYHKTLGKKNKEKTLYINNIWIYNIWTYKHIIYD